jgi:hypothetical protein
MACSLVGAGPSKRIGSSAVISGAAGSVVYLKTQLNLPRYWTPRFSSALIAKCSDR